ncbi:MAG TPA: hypothetical protein VGE09_08265 [Pseudoxanthomonas sp.]
MADMVEKVARAIMAATSTHVHRPYDMTTCRIIARAAVEALRNPPDRVLDAMNPSGRYASIVIPEAWNDALDAILKEEGNG